jgi:hypothetical protein
MPTKKACSGSNSGNRAEQPAQAARIRAPSDVKSGLGDYVFEAADKADDAGDIARRDVREEWHAVSRRIDSSG